MHLTVATLVILVATNGQGPAETQTKERKDQLEKWKAYYQEVADGYDFRLASEPETRLKVSPKPIHFYTNPSSGLDTHGAFFVWTSRGRAEAVGAIWSKLTSNRDDRRVVHHEFQSLATEAFDAKGTDGLVWSPREPGIDPQLIPGAPKPAKSKKLRLAQMRSLARGFTGYHIHPVERQLRVLPQPIYRYQVDSDTDEDLEVTDGAIFGLFQEWDPEILLVIEVRKTEDGPAWHFGAGRFSNRRLRLEYGGVDVWSYPREDFGSPNGPFFAALGVTVRPTEIK